MKIYLSLTILALSAFAATATTTKAPVTAHTKTAPHVQVASDPFPICTQCDNGSKPSFASVRIVTPQQIAEASDPFPLYCPSCPRPEQGN